MQENGTHRQIAGWGKKRKHSAVRVATRKRKEDSMLPTI
jgi:hypothetical protein